MCPGNPIFEDYALQAIHALMERRSALDLFGSAINMLTMEWMDFNGGIGASSDSFYEYLLKAYILFGWSFPFPHGMPKLRA